MSGAGGDLRRADDLPDPLALLGDVQACAVLLLATSEDLDSTDAGELRLVTAAAFRRLRRAVEDSTPGAVEAVRKALGGDG